MTVRTSEGSVHLRPPPRVLITAGPTHEPIDRVRYIGNRSSGRMGIALAQASARRNWPTTLLLGPTSITLPESSHLHIVRFQTTADLQRLLREHWPNHDLLIMAAAVADYRPVPQPKSPQDKIKRSETHLTLELESTPDLLAEIAASSRANQVRVGFALEPSERLMDSARSKLQRKQLHAIVANPLETMDAIDVTATLLLASGRIMSAGVGISKQQFAEWLLDSLEKSVFQQHENLSQPARN